LHNEASRSSWHSFAAYPTATKCSAVRGTCMHTWRSVGRLHGHTEADSNRPRHKPHICTSQKKQRHAMTCLCAACNSAMLNCDNAAVRTGLLNWEVRLLTLGLSGTDFSALRPPNVKASFVVFLPLLDNCWTVPGIEPRPLHSIQFAT